MRLLGWLAVLGMVTGHPAGAADALAPYRVEGDAIREPLAQAPGDAARGRDVLMGRDTPYLTQRTAAILGRMNYARVP